VASSLSPILRAGSSTPPPAGELVLLCSTKPYVCVLQRRLAFSLAETDVLVHFVFVWFVEAEADVEAKAEAEV